MRRVKIIATVVAVLLLVIISFQNPTPVEFRFLWMGVDVPKIILIVVSGLVGSAATLIIQFLLRPARAESLPAAAPPVSRDAAS